MSKTFTVFRVAQVEVLKLSMLFFFRGFQIKHSSKMFFRINSFPSICAGRIDLCTMQEESEL